MDDFFGSIIDQDELFKALVKDLNHNHRPVDFHRTPSVILTDSVINDLELQILSHNDQKSAELEELIRKNNQKFKLSFEELLIESVKNQNATRPQGTMESTKKPRLNATKMNIRQKLPVFVYEDKITEAVENHTFVLIKGETGSGKTTQIPQMILDYHMKRGSYCKIVCTQPRRISAISVAERVAYERDEPIGESVGYQIRLENKQPQPADSILYCTTGILLRMMVSDPVLGNVSHIILDEIHERSVDSDLLIGLIQILVKHNKQIKVLIMSATFGFEEYSKNFSNFKIINIEGSLFPVKNFYLEQILHDLNFDEFKSSGTYLQKRHSNFYLTPEGRAEVKKHNDFCQMINQYVLTIQHKYSRAVITALQNPYSEDLNVNLIEKLINHIHRTMPAGAILVFLPGYEKICDLHEMLHENDNYLVYPLHSLISTDEQKGVFEKPPQGTRKIVLATNIAETSITIDDIVYVINSGKVKIKKYDIKNKIETLEEYWITKANATQRQGRAGRCQPGVCFNLYTECREKTFEEYPIPEIQRTRMETVIMCLKSLGIQDVKQFLGTLISAPHHETIDNAIRFLQKINALDQNEILTPLGYQLAMLPIEPQIGKMLLMATIFNCVDPISTIAATLSLKEPFRRVIGKEKELDEAKKEFSEHSRSDHITYVNVLKQYRKAAYDDQTKQFCYENFVVRNSVLEIERMKIQLCELLASLGFIEHSLPEHYETNKNSTNAQILSAIITSGLYPNVALLRSATQKFFRSKQEYRVEHIIQTPEDGIRVKFHCTSVNRFLLEFNSCFFVYFIKHKSGNNIFLRETTNTSAIAIILFADSINMQTNAYGETTIVVGKNELFLKSNERTANLFLKLRQRFENILEKWCVTPSAIRNMDVSDRNVIDAFKRLFNQDTC